MVSDGSQWISFDPNGSWWMPSPNGFQWSSMDLDGSWWIPMNPEGSQEDPDRSWWFWWIPKDPDGSIWIPMDPDGSRLIQMDPDGSRWILMNLDGSRWILIDVNGSRWINLMLKIITQNTVNRAFIWLKPVSVDISRWIQIRHGILYNSSASVNLQSTGFHKMFTTISLFYVTFLVINALIYKEKTK
jgi:hypothetical protein